MGELSMVGYVTTTPTFRAELAQILAHPTGAVRGMTAADLVSDAQQMADFPDDYTQVEVVHMLATLAGLLDEVNGLLK